MHLPHCQSPVLDTWITVITAIGTVLFRLITEISIYFASMRPKQLGLETKRSASCERNDIHEVRAFLYDIDAI